MVKLYETLDLKKLLHKKSQETLRWKVPKKQERKQQRQKTAIENQSEVSRFKTEMRELSVSLNIVIGNVCTKSTGTFCLQS